MADPISRYRKMFDQRQLRERALVAITLIVLLVGAWWTYHANPRMQLLSALDQQNLSTAKDNRQVRDAIDGIRQRVAGGVHREKRAELVMLGEHLQGLEQELRLKTIELIPPEKMFTLMNQLIIRDSRLTLHKLARREVKSAIPNPEPAKAEEGPGIYRHVLEIQLSGRYLDILAYMKTLEALDWRLLWDEIEIRNEDYPRVDVRLVMSTLSTEKQWVGI